MMREIDSDINSYLDAGAIFSEMQSAFTGGMPTTNTFTAGATSSLISSSSKPSKSLSKKKSKNDTSTTAVALLEPIMEEAVVGD